MACESSRGVPATSQMRMTVAERDMAVLGVLRAELTVAK